MIFYLANKLLKLLSRISSKKGYEYVAKMSEEDIVRNVGYLAHALRDIRKKGAGISMYPIKLALNQGYKTVIEKEKEGKIIFGFERWLKENFRFLIGCFTAIKAERFTDLPHCDGVPRVAILADFIVRYSGNKVTEEKIKKITDAFNAVTPLTYPEIEGLFDAIRYRLLFEISLFAERAISYFASDKRRKNKRNLRRFASSDSFLCYYANAYQDRGVEEELPKEIDWNGAMLGFENVLASNELLISRYIESLRALPKGDDERRVSYSKTDSVYARDRDYRNMSASAKKDYLAKTHEIASRLNVKEEVVASAALTLGDSHGVHFGEMLFHHANALREYLRSGRILTLKDEQTVVQGGYATVVLLLTLLLSLFPAFYWRTTLTYAAILPIFVIALHPVEYLIKRWSSLRVKSRPLPQMDYETLPEECKTIVVASRFIASEKDAEEARMQIESLASSFRDPSVSYLVLADFPASDSEFTERDGELLDYIRKMKRSEKVSYLVRKRVQKGEKYVAYERKRGAILDLFRAVLSGTSEQFHLIGDMPDGRFAVLLDDDSELLPRTIRAAVMAMAHPLNDRYDLMSFGGRINRFSLTTYYSEKFARSCGVDAYPFYSDYYADRFDAALYCGKAIVRIDRYFEKLKNFFPDGRILSHDIIEGAVLKSTSLKRCVYEDAPSTFSGDQQRESRWQRGDIQLLPYAFCNRVRNRVGERVKNPIQPIYKLIIFINGISVLRDFMTFSLLIVCYFLGAFQMMAYLLICHLFVYLYAVVASLRLMGKVRIGELIRSVLFSLWLFVESFIMIPYRALNGAFLFIATSLKMAFRSKNLLEWKPFRFTQGAGGFEDGARLLLPSWIVMTLLMMVAGDYRVSVVVLLYYMYGLFLIISGRSVKEKKGTEEEKKILTAQAEKIYRYFSSFHDAPLIPDNLQIFPYAIRAKMTSPTNLGFAFLAEVCAAKLQLISTEEAISNLIRLLDKTENLERWRGHLYNWYDADKQTVMSPRVVSTVDSANYLACLMVVSSFFNEEGRSDLAARAESRIMETDFTALYHEEDRALVIVRNLSEGRECGRYDLLASEARLAYYFLIMQGVDPACYFMLGRECSPRYGNTLLSWSGTAFEYMLPRIFVKSPRGSLLYEQEYRSGRAQIEDKSGELFGRSECGYHELNDATAYRYKAVGCAALALSEEREDVIAPYASYLYLPLFPKPCLENLNKIRLYGAEGEYGFYEAVDFAREGKIVRSFMTHHQGMSLAAITNRVCEDEICRLFSLSPRMRSVRLLLAEENIHTKPPKIYLEKGGKDKVAPTIHETPSLIPSALPFSDGRYTLWMDSLGRSSASLGGRELNAFCEYKREKGGIFVQIKEKGRITSPSYFPCGDASCSAELSENGIRYVGSDGSVMEGYPLKGYEGEMRRITLKNEGETPRHLTLSVYSNMILNTRDAYDSHPAYSDLFLRAEYDEKRDAAYLWRRDGEGKTPIGAAMLVKGLGELRYNCNRYNVIGRGGDYRADYALGVEKTLAPKEGDVLYPCFAFSGTLEIPPLEERTVYVLLLGGEDKGALCDRVDKLDLAYRSGALDLLGRAERADKVDLPLLARTFGRLLYESPTEEALSTIYESREVLEKAGIDTSQDILFYRKEGVHSTEEIEEISRISKRINDCGFPHTLVIGCDRVTGAGMDSVESTKQLLDSLEIRGVIVSGEMILQAEKAALIIFGREEKKGEPITNEHFDLPEILPVGEIEIKCGEGGFLSEGYAVRPFGKETLLPYTNVVAGLQGGFIATERGGGFTFGNNAREEKLTVWSGDAVEDTLSETLSLTVGENKYLLNGSGCVHRIGSTVYSHRICDSAVRVEEYLVADGRTKVYDILISSDLPENGVLSLSLITALGWRFSDRVFTLCEEGSYTLLRADTGKSAFLYSPDCELVYSPPKTKGERLTFRQKVPIRKGRYRIMLGIGQREEISEEALPIARAKTYAELYVNRIQAETGIASLDRLYNRMIPYQVLSSRLNARCGFYQCGGAYGFRDQLQDCLALLISEPGRCRERILDAACHQYEEGDVQHWWHPPRIGVRTRISDDRLWLVYLTERYIEVTGDHALLDVEIPFLSSPPLAEGEISRYEVPNIGEKGTLREHLLRAIRISLSYGEHGLLKMGSGDWNDGLDRVGVKGRGESVWLTLFARKVIEDATLFFCDADRLFLHKEVGKLESALRPLLKNGRFPLAFADDGSWLGYKDNPACTLALNPQTWAVIAGGVKEEDALRALDTASALIDERYDLIKLSTPPFDLSADYGYVAAYPKGVRENGGQYTHAAVWYLKALLMARRKEEAYRILRSLNPILRTDSEEKTVRYKGEPYVLAADIYGAEPYQGRMGWSWYTGSAGWLKYVITEDFFGIRKRGDRLFVKPCFPASFDRLRVKIRLPEKRIVIDYARSDKDRLFLEGREIEALDLGEEGEEVKLLCHFR